MRKRNPTRAEKIAIAAAAPRLKIANWLIVEKYPDRFVLEHKSTGTKKTVYLKKV